MTVEQINSLVTKVAQDFDCGVHDTHNLQRYFVYKYCHWMTKESIGELFGVHRHNVHASIKKVERDSAYVFMKLKIHESIKNQIQ